MVSLREVFAESCTSDPLQEIGRKFALVNKERVHPILVDGDKLVIVMFEKPPPTTNRYTVVQMFGVFFRNIEFLLVFDRETSIRPESAVIFDDENFRSESNPEQFLGDIVIDAVDIKREHVGVFVQ